MNMNVCNWKQSPTKISCYYPFSAFPCVFALCTHRYNYLYNVIIKEVQKAVQRMNKRFLPSMIMSDYEGGFMKVIKEEVSGVLYKY